jgi:DivIVA domain-containing protein
MPWVFAILVVVLIVAFALVLAGRLPSVPQPTRDRFTTGLPPRPRASDVDHLRLPVVFRGYRMSEVDEALAVLRNRIAELEGVSAQPAVMATDESSPFAPPGDDDG